MHVSCGFSVYDGPRKTDEDCPPLAPEASCTPREAWQDIEEGEEGRLSDLDSDVDQYIASEKEVMKSKTYCTSLNGCAYVDVSSSREGMQ